MVIAQSKKICSVNATATPENIVALYAGHYNILIWGILGLCSASIPQGSSESLLVRNSNIVAPKNEGTMGMHIDKCRYACENGAWRSSVITLRLNAEIRLGTFRHINLNVYGETPYGNDMQRLLLMLLLILLLLPLLCRVDLGTSMFCSEMSFRIIAA